ncbi:FAD-dependent oxidoreductase [Microbacterium timonense]|uniref:FAD-dependent oxidoreductase n=1 Tax=Microbacterium timonense TaxID=2086576 RepID=UPI000D0F833B|nr:FAD-dependent oxidoreductase [Microbacterium timonense]
MIAADVTVYGATSAGVCAAVAAARTGARVVLLEPGRHVGGMTSGGLGYTDVGDVRALGGMAAEFRAAVADHYGVAVGHYAGPEPHVAEEIFLRWIEEAGVLLVTDARLSAVEVRDGRIARLTLADGSTAEAAVFVDASYEGDLLAAAGVSYAVGRESRALYGEQFAGRREVVPGRHSLPPWISPFRDDDTGLNAGPLLPQIKPEPMAEVGEGDGGIMSFGYRVCLSSAPDRIPFRRRDGYDDAHWELGRRIFADAARRGDVHPAGRYLGLEPNLPGGKADGNSLGPFSLSVLDGSAWEYPDADPVRREEIRLHHLRHAEDFLWFLANDPAVPAGVRRDMQAWGLPADEFADTGHLPHQLYVREARRMLSDAVLTEHDLRAGAVPPDVVALGSYHLDIREVQRSWRWVYEHPDPIAMAVTEGYLSVRVPVYGIGYGSLVPRREECTNLVVAVCVSASHVAFSSLRMEPQYQMLGHAAGLAAASAARGGHAVQDADTDHLQQRLRDGGAVLAV